MLRRKGDFYFLLDPKFRQKFSCVRCLIVDGATRYLTAVDASYYGGLSEASKQSLRYQGGPFQGEELEDFEQDPLKDEMVKLRKWDDQAKVVGIESETPRAATYRNMIRRHLKGQI